MWLNVILNFTNINRNRYLAITLGKLGFIEGPLKLSPVERG